MAVSFAKEEMKSSFHICAPQMSRGRAQFYIYVLSPCIYLRPREANHYLSSRPSFLCCCRVELSDEARLCTGLAFRVDTQSDYVCLLYIRNEKNGLSWMVYVVLKNPDVWNLCFPEYLGYLLFD